VGRAHQPRELRAIADVVEKYNAPMVKSPAASASISSGIKKEDLPAVWADLNAAGMVSGHAYGKALRTVKTCVGSEWCRFGTQDSTGSGSRIEQMTWGSWMPHKFKIAVSGCPRTAPRRRSRTSAWSASTRATSCTSAATAGSRSASTDLLCKVATEEEALEHCAAFIQLYREDAHYLERTAPWIERKGLEWLKAQLFAEPTPSSGSPRGSAIRRSSCRTIPGPARRPATAATCTATSPPSAPPRSTLTCRPKWLDIGPVTQIEPGMAATLPVEGGEEIAVFHTMRGEFYALVNKCPHKQGPLEPGHRPRRQRHLPAAQLEDLAAQRPGARHDRGCVPTIPTRSTRGDLPAARGRSCRDARPAAGKAA
jgi:hypothetical protein